MVRLERYARASGAGTPCRGCGFRPGEPVTGIRIVAPEVVSRVGELSSCDTSGDSCEQCGRRLVLRIPPPVLARVSA